MSSEANESASDKGKAVRIVPLVFDAHEGFVTALVFLKNGDLVSGGRDEPGGGTIKIWDAQAGKLYIA